MVPFPFPSEMIQAYSNSNCRGHAHPRITGYKNPISKSFTTLQAAREYMTGNGVAEPMEIIKSEDESTTPVRGNGFYAVANGNNPGVYPFYR